MKLLRSYARVCEFERKGLVERASSPDGAGQPLADPGPQLAAHRTAGAAVAMNVKMCIFRRRQRTAEERRELHQLETLRAIATVEFAKGVIVLLLAFGVLSLVRRGDLWDFVEGILDFLHIDPVGRFAQRFLELADRLGDTRLWLLATYAGCYCTLRFVEAYGLWNARVWAEWVALISGAIYLPFELYELFRRITIIRASVLIVNLGIVLYMLYLRTIARSQHPAV